VGYIFITLHSKGGRDIIEAPAVQFTPDPKTVYEEIRSPSVVEYENLTIRS
uniref:Uncharacterized protein n=1 Tax=Ciona savignyi TaxID=51511 RepID=H2YC32_CIOSA